MIKKIFIIIFSIFIAIFQSSFVFDNIRINWMFIFLVYLLFFDEINNVFLSLVVGGLMLDLFSSNFSGYFFGFLVVFLILNYIYRNILSNDRFITYLSLNFLGILIFNIIFYIIGVVTRNFSKVYFFELSLVFKYFLLELVCTILVSLFIYFIVNLISPKTRDRLIIIGG